MTPHRIILFRGMNTGGVRAPVAAQRQMALDLGLENPRTLLASGNLVVQSDLAPAKLESLVQTGMRTAFGLEIAAMVRTPTQWTELMSANPFARQAQDHPSRVLAMIMRDAARPDGVAEVQALASGGEQLEMRDLNTGGTVLYFWLPQGQGQSRMVDRATPARIGLGTGRNWNTVLKLAQMIAP